MTRIVVFNTAASSGGALTILRSLYDFVATNEECKDFEWVFVLSERHFPETEHIKIIVNEEVKKSWLNRLKFDLFTGKKYIKKLQADIVISLQNTIINGLDCPQILYVQQSIPFQTDKKFSFFKKEEQKLAVYQYIIGKLIKQSIKKADHVIVQANWMKNAVIQSTRIKADSITVIPPKQPDLAKYIQKEYEPTNKFFYPASNEIYKNHQVIYDAIDLLNEKGINDFEVILTLNKEREHPNIKFIGSIDYEEVIKYYQETILLFPSYVETVGLPLLEAMQINRIVLAADTEYAREVLKNYKNTYYFNPFKAETLANLMLNILTNPLEKIKMNKNFKVQESWSEYLLQIIRKNR